MPDDEPISAPVVDATHVGPLHLDDAHGRWVFEPRADITALELSLIMVLLVHTLNQGRRLDWREYLTRDRGMVSTLPPGVVARVQPGGPEVLVARKIDLARHFRQVE